MLAGTMAGASDPVARFSATATNVNPNNGDKSDTVRIDLLRWSTDAERDQLLSAFKDDRQFFDALGHEPSIGYIWTHASVGFSVRYAYRVLLPDGAERVVLATDKRLDSGGPGAWEATVQRSAHDYPFTVIELRMNGNAGEGKMSLAASVVVDADAKTIGLDHYAAAPVLLKGVKREAVAP